MTYVTCPTMRYHPAVVAQKAATLGVLSDGRFTLGLGAGENLNEHVVGEGWPAVDDRHDMLEEALEIIRALLAGELLTYAGDTSGSTRPGSGTCPRSRCRSGRRLRDRVDPAVLAAGRPPGRGRARRRPVRAWEDAVGPARPARPQDRTAADLLGPRPRHAPIARAHEQFRWFAGGWKVNADLPTHGGFAAASQFVPPDDVAERSRAGRTSTRSSRRSRPFWEAGFTDVASCRSATRGRTGSSSAAGPLLERLRAAAP